MRPAPRRSRDPPAPALSNSPLLLSQARTLCQKHDAVLYQNPFLAYAESDQPWGLSQNDFFFLGGNSTFGRERMKHLKRSACQQRKAVIGVKGRKTFPGSLSSVQRYQKELIHILSFTHQPNTCNRQKCWDPPQKLSRSPWDGQQCLCSCCSPLLQPLQWGKGSRTLPKSLTQFFPPIFSFPPIFFFSPIFFQGICC